MMIKKIIKPDCIVATAGLFIIFWLFMVVSPFSFDFLTPLNNMFADFDYTDIVFSQLKKTEKIDDRIIIVNISNLPKSEIAKQIDNISKYKPKVIALDVYPLIINPNNPQGDSLFVAACKKVKNFVLASKLDSWNEDKDLWEKHSKSPSIFSNHLTNAYVNLFIDDFETVREFTSKQKTQNGIAISFPAAAAKYYDKSAFDYLMKRNKELEKINYVGNTNAYMIIDAYQALENDATALSNVKDKIVLMGYLGDDLLSNSLIDKYYTPLNPRYVGKADRDMHGVVIHANAISTILSRNYIHAAPEWINYISAVFLCYLNMLVFSYIYKNKQELFEVATIAGLLIEMFLIILFMYYFYLQFQMTIDLSLGIAAVGLSANALEIYYNIFQPAIRKAAKYFKNLIFPPIIIENEKLLESEANE